MAMFRLARSMQNSSIFDYFVKSQKMELQDFSTYAHSIISGFAGVVLVVFWGQGRRMGGGQKDLGFIYLGLGLLLWTVMGALELSFPDGLAGKPGGANHFDRFVRRILSVLNSSFFLLTLPYFEHGFEGLRKQFPVFGHPDKWRNLVLGAAAATLALTLVMFSRFPSPEEEWLASLPDNLLSFLAVAALSYALFESFRFRGMLPLSIMTLAVLLALLLVQVLDPSITGGEATDLYYLMRLCSHSLLGMLFFALAYSWMMERAEEIKATVRPGRERRSKGNGVRQGNGGERKEIWLGARLPGKYYVRLDWPAKGCEGVEFNLSEGRFKYLLLSAVRAKRRAFVDGDRDVRFLWGGNIDRSNNGVKDAFSKAMQEHGHAIDDRAELFESAGQGSGKYRLNFTPNSVHILTEGLHGDVALSDILSELSA